MQRESYREAMICEQVGVTSQCSSPGTQGVPRTWDLQF